MHEEAKLQHNHALCRTTGNFSPQSRGTRITTMLCLVPSRDNTMLRFIVFYPLFTHFPLGSSHFSCMS